MTLSTFCKQQVLIWVGLLLPLIGLAQSNTNYLANTFNSDKPRANNTFVGHEAGANTTTGFENTFIGSQGGQYSKEGGLNTSVGYQAGQQILGGGANTFMGVRAGYYNGNGYGNTSIGTDAGYNNHSDFNVFLGEQRVGIALKATATFLLATAQV